MTHLRPDEWLEPWWLERQRDPQSPDFVPGTDRVNVTHRSWTRLGTLAGRDRAVVDPRGMVTSAAMRWSLDWWIGADDRWHLPSREVAVRQRLVDDAPVVETAMRVPGGDAVHRVYAVAGPDGPILIVEVQNDTAIPFAVSFAVRPAHPLGDGRIERIDLDGEQVTVDGMSALRFTRAPARVASSTGAQGDVVHAVLAGLATERWAGPVVCPDGRAQAAFVFPLPHTAVLRVAVPLTASRAPAAVRLPDPVPDVARVARGWAEQAERGARIDLPDDRVQRALAAGRRHLLLAVAGEDLATWPARATSWVDVAEVAGACDRLGWPAEAEQLLIDLPDRQSLDGYVGGDGGWAANGAALHAIGTHWRLTRDDAFVEGLVGPVAKAAHWLDRQHGGRRSRRARSEPGVVGRAWATRGLRDAADALAGARQPEVAEDALRFAERIAAALHAERPTRPSDVAGAALAFSGGADPWTAMVAQWARERFEVDGALFDGEHRRGLDLRASLWLAAAEVRAGDRRALTRVRRLLDLASPTWCWPSVVHPRSGGGAAGDGADPSVTAAWCDLVCRLVADERDDGLALSPLVPDTWLGRSRVVHALPTGWGTLSYAVRWHGERPALLWDLAVHPGVGPVRLCAPGLDPGWTSTEPAGEALLQPVRPADGDPSPSPEASSSFG